MQDVSERWKMRKLIYRYRHFFSALIALIVAFLVIFICGCSHTISIKGNCKQKALYTATTFMEEGYKVRIVFGESSTPGETHVQAQALVDRKWRWLEKLDDEVITGRQHRFTPDFNKVYDPMTILSWCMF